MPSPSASNLLVFTDLDATLLDHETYDWRPAQPALDELKRRGVPVIFNSSKTKAEQLVLRAEIGNEHPFIVENGAAVYFPADYFAERPEDVEVDGELLLRRFGASRKAILDLLAELRSEGCEFEGFADWTPARLAEVAGLPLERAAPALERCCSEPLLWAGDPASLNYLKERAAAAGMRLVQGGRFLHLMGRFDKAEALGWLRRQYESDGKARQVAALGDSPNDAAMLDAADVAVVIQSARSASIEPSGPIRVIRTTLPGPAGWNAAVLELLSDRSEAEEASQTEGNAETS